MKQFVFTIFLIFKIVHSPLYAHVLSEKEMLSNEILNKVAFQLKKEYDLYPCGTMGKMMNHVEKIGLFFKYFKPTDINGARELLLNTIHTFTQTINKDTHIRPYLENFPFEPHNLYIVITMHNPDGTNVKNGGLVIAATVDGNLEYQIDNADDKKLITMLKESYEEALRNHTVNRSQQNQKSL